jgi:hypothetical protein
MEFRKGNLALSALMSLGAPNDVTLQELHIEAFCPADEATEHASRRLAAG